MSLKVTQSVFAKVTVVVRRLELPNHLINEGLGFDARNPT